MAIIAHNSGILTSRTKTSSKITFRLKTPNHNAQFLSGTTEEIFKDTFLLDNTQEAVDSFYKIAYSLLDKYYPVKTVLITSAYPEFVTPEIKYLLRNKNCLMRANKTEEAGTIAAEIGTEIARYNSRRLKHLGKETTSCELWEAVRQVTGKAISKSTSNLYPPSLTADALNNHYSEISSDSMYTRPIMKSTSFQNSNLNISEFYVFNILDNLTHTAEGLDNLPAWFLRVAAPVFFKSHYLYF